jgi:hypothetical protein
VSRQKALTFQTRVIAGSGGLPHQTAYPSSKNFGWMVSWESSPEVALAEGLCKLGGITSAEGLHDGEAGHAPFQLSPGIRLTTEEKHGKPQSGQPSSHRTTRCANLAVFEGLPRLACWTSVHPSYPGGFSQPSVGTSASRVAGLRGSPHQLTSSRNSRPVL